MAEISFLNESTPSTPASGYTKAYVDTADKLLKQIDDTGTITTFGGGANVALSNLASVAINTALLLGTSDGGALGSTTKMWSDLFLASGGIINWNNGNITLTHSAGILTLGGGDLALGANNITMTGSLGATGARLTKGWFTDLQVTNAISGSITGNAATVTTNANLTGVITSVGNATSIASQTGTGTKFVVDTTPTLVTPVLGVATATSINGLTITSSTGVLTITNAKTLSVAKTLTLDGTDSTTMTFPSTSATVARTDAAQTFTGTQTFSQTILTANAITASGNAATVPVTSGRNIVTNNSAATLTVTMTTTSAVNMQTCIVQILDASGVAQTISWVNTENSTTSVPTTSNGSTTLPLSIGFVYNSATSKWRCVASS